MQGLVAVASYPLGYLLIDSASLECPIGPRWDYFGNNKEAKFLGIQVPRHAACLIW